MNMAGAGAYGSMQTEGRWWEAFGTGGYDGEPGLMEGEYRFLGPEGMGECGRRRTVCAATTRSIARYLV